MKCKVDLLEISIVNCRAPQGARGLKYTISRNGDIGAASRPARGAWVEIGFDVLFRYEREDVAPRKGRVG